jgi:hypothetical protein
LTHHDFVLTTNGGDLSGHCKRSRVLSGGVNLSNAFFSSVSLLLPFDGTDGDTSTSDESLVGNAVTFNGTAQSITDTKMRRY